MSGTGQKNDSAKPKARLIALYLPQFHPIPENDEWWGKGFTEWTNVAKARPLFPGHYQPHIPADLGFYDLRLPEVRQAQVDLAKEHGIEGFCYWHYWFGNGKRLLERPFNEVLESGEPDFPFCLGWANESWTGIWHGAPDRMLIEQNYPGPGDEKNHFYSILNAFKDPRYIKIEGKPIFLIYKPYLIPNAASFIKHWQTLAIREGLKGIYFIANILKLDWNPQHSGFDSFILHNPITRLTLISQKGFFRAKFWLLMRGLLRILGKPFVFPYSSFIKKAPFEIKGIDQFPCIVPNWDCTPRRGSCGYILLNSSPDLFQQHLRDSISEVSETSPEKRRKLWETSDIIFRRIPWSLVIWVITKSPPISPHIIFHRITILRNFIII